MIRSPRADVARVTRWGLLTAALVLTGIYFGSRRLRDVDAALVPYAGASVLSAFGLGYRYSMWLTKPPTRLFWRRGWGLFFAPSRVVHNVSRLVALFAVNVVAQRFIEKRSPLRWAVYWCIFWGCILAAAITFPLSFGWIHFETAGAALERYQAFVFGVHVFTFDLSSPIAPLVFNILDISAVLAIFTLLYLPFGKFFHIFQRPAQLGVAFLRRRTPSMSAAPWSTRPRGARARRPAAA